MFVLDLKNQVELADHFQLKKLATKFLKDKLEMVDKGEYEEEEMGEWVCMWMGECFPYPDGMEDGEWEKMEASFWNEVEAIINKLKY